MSVVPAGGVAGLQTEAAVHVLAQSEMCAAAVGRRVSGHRPAATQRPRDPAGNRHVRHQTVLRLPDSSLRTEVRTTAVKRTDENQTNRKNCRMPTGK